MDWIERRMERARRLPRPVMRVRAAGQAGVAVVFATTVVLVAWPGALDRVWPGAWFRELALMMILASPLGVTCVAWMRAEGRIRRRSERTGGAMCLNCGYELTGCGARGECPECGRGFDLAQTRERWAWVWSPGRLE